MVNKVEHTAAAAYTCQITNSNLSASAITAKNTQPPNEPIMPPLSTLYAEYFLSLACAILPITAKITGKVENNPLHIAPIFADITVTNIIKQLTNNIFSGSSHAAVKGLASGANFNLLDASASTNKVLSESTDAKAIFTGNNKVNALKAHHSVNAANNALTTPYFASMAA